MGRGMMRTLSLVVIPGTMIAFAALLLTSYLESGPSRFHCMLSSIVLWRCDPPGYTLLEQILGASGLIVGAFAGYRLGVGPIDWSQS